MMLTTEEAERVYRWYCSVTRGDHQAIELLQSVGLMSIHPSKIILLLASPDFLGPSTSYLKIVDEKKFFWSRIKYGF
jgi:hypothetical protein